MPLSSPDNQLAALLAANGIKKPMPLSSIDNEIAALAAAGAGSSGVAQPLNILSRGNPTLTASFNAHTAGGVYVIDVLLNPQDNQFYLLYIPTAGPFNYCLAKGPSQIGPWTDLGAIPGGPTIDGAENGRLILDTGSGKWGLFYITSATGNLGLYQTVASGTITSTYSLTSSTLIVPGTSGAWDDTKIREPHIFNIGSTWYCLYMATSTAGSPSGHEQSGYATASAPEGPWTKYGSNPIIPSAAAAGAFDNTITADPNVVFCNGVYYILYSCEGQNVSSGNGSACYQTAITSTVDWVNFTKHGMAFPPALAAAGVPDCGAVWKTSLWWPGKVAGDNTQLLPADPSLTVYLYYLARSGSQSATSPGNLVTSFYATIPSTSFINGPAAIARGASGNNYLWTRVEAESFAAPLTTVGAHDNTTNWHDINSGSGSSWTRGWSGSGAIWNNQVAGNSQMLTWSGTRARVCMLAQAAYGIADIYLDGVLIYSFDSNYLAGLETSGGGTSKCIAYDTGPLAYGTHTLKVQATNRTTGTGTYIGIDYWEYL